MPRGLRSFDQTDADFFLELLPGPVDRMGLPDSIRFWRSKIESQDSEQSFSVGLIYGPSGCGKSSLMKAGIIPRLADTVLPIYIEATGNDTELRLARAIQKKIPSLDGDRGLKDTLTAIRRGQGLPPGKSLLLVIDQFEQWLHAKDDYRNTELTAALRQCDGVQVRCIVMVRDDFWLSVSRFMRELEVDLEASNSRLVDLFDLDHAARVLGIFGRAFGKLPDSSLKWTKDQNEFVQQAVAGLAQDRKVVCVRLALFAEMMKSRDWTTTALREVGGTEGVGTTFLEETFSSRSAPPQYRHHQEAARAVLATLLPEADSDIKGHMRSYDALLEASGYSQRPRDFADLLRILDSELRLITPSDPEGERQGVSPPSSTGTSPSSSPHAPRFYQLTHDYLVPSLRDWLTRKQKETRRGRAELKLAERSARWSAKRENRHLPSAWEWLSMRTLTNGRLWTLPQRTMMRKASRVHLVRWGGGVLLSLIVGLGIQQWLSSRLMASLREQVVTAVDTVHNVRGAAVPFAIRDLREKYPADMVTKELKTRFESDTDSHRKLGLAFALADYGTVHAEFLAAEVATVSVEDASNLVEALEADRKASLKVLGSEAAISTDEKNWRRKSRLAILALHLGDPEPAADMCQFKNRPDPVQRTVFIDEFPKWHGDLLPLSRVAPTIDDAALRSAICLAVGGVPIDRVTPETRDAWAPLLADWHQHQLDTGTHSASGWALRQWALPLPQLPVGEPERSDEQIQRIAFQVAEVANLQQQINAAENELLQGQTAWEEQLLSQLPSIAVIPGDIASLSPSGTQVVITTSENHVVLHDLETSQDRVLHELCTDAAISPGANGLIAMVSPEANSGRSEVLLLDPDSASVRSVGHGGYPTWAAHGSTLFFQDMNTLAVMSFNVTDPGARPKALIRSIPSNYPAVSPDKTKVAFFADEAILVLDITTSNTIAKYATPGWDGALPGWMSDSRHVGFGSYANGDGRGLWILDTETGMCFMAVPGNATRPSWSRDGSRMLYENRTEHKIHVVTWSPEQQQLLADDNRLRNEATESIRQLQDQFSEAKAMLSDVIPQWNVNREGLTIFRFPAGQFRNDDGNTVEVPGDFLLSDREISVGQFQRFIEDADYPAAEKPADWEGADQEYGSTPEHPVQYVSWYDAVLYCNWLSQKEGLSPAYERTGAKEPGSYRGNAEYDAWRLIEGSSGYRLPREIEWEYACRAGTTTGWASGDDQELLRYYSQQTALITQPCGTKLPNALGLYDMHGNVWEFCDDKLQKEHTNRVMRGGAFNDQAANARSSNQSWTPPGDGSNNIGFRVARTLPPFPLIALPPDEGRRDLKK